MDAAFGAAGLGALDPNHYAKFEMFLRPLIQARRNAGNPMYIYIYANYQIVTSLDRPRHLTLPVLLPSLFNMMCQQNTVNSGKLGPFHKDWCLPSLLKRAKNGDTKQSTPVFSTFQACVRFQGPGFTPLELIRYHESMYCQWKPKQCNYI